jgi:hypothetical protein
VQVGDVIERDERDEAEVDERAHRDHAGKQYERPPCVVFLRRPDPTGVDIGAELPQAGQLVQHHGGHQHGGDQQQHGARQAEQEHQRRDQDRTEGEPEVPTDREQAHPARPALAGDVVGEA